MHIKSLHHRTWEYFCWGCITHWDTYISVRCLNMESSLGTADKWFPSRYLKIIFIIIIYCQFCKYRKIRMLNNLNKFIYEYTTSGKGLHQNTVIFSFLHSLSMLLIFLLLLCLPRFLRCSLFLLASIINSIPTVTFILVSTQLVWCSQGLQPAGMKHSLPDFKHLKRILFHFITE